MSNTALSIAGFLLAARRLGGNETRGNCRRYTNVYLREGGVWRHLARHANVVP